MIEPTQNESCSNKAQKGTLIFDGTCGICSLAHKKIREKDVFHKLQCLPFQSTNPEKLGFPSELHEKSLCYIREDGRKFTGARGFFEVVKVLPGFWGTVGRVLGRPILNVLMEPIYRIVARNRFFLSNLLRLRPMINERKKVNII